MAALTVTPKYLEQLALSQDQAAEKATAAGGVTSEIFHKVKVTHGVISMASNYAFRDAEAARSSASEYLQQASEDLAANLRKGERQYAAVDLELGENLDKQVVDP